MLTGALPGQLSILEVLLKEEKKSCFDEILLAVWTFPEPEKKTANSGSPNLAACCKSHYLLASNLICTASENVVSIQDKQCLSIADVAQEFVSRDQNSKRNSAVRQLQKVAIFGRYI